MNSISLIRSILGAARGSILPLAYAVNVAAERMFIDHVVEDDLKLCEDVCRAAGKRLPGQPSAKAVTRQVERTANRCWDKLVKEGKVKEYIGEQISDIDGPRMMVIYLATLAYFDKTYFEMVAECPEVFMGQLPSVPSLP